MSPGRLGIDFGTSHTVAVVSMPDGRREPLLFDSSPLMPSGVFADGARLLAGRDAQRAGRLEPARYEPNPKRRIDDEVLLLGDAEVRVADAIAAVFARVREEAVRALGREPSGVALTHPAVWGPRRRQVLLDAAAAAGLGPVELVAEPVAAAAYFATVTGRQVATGQAVVVYDLGAGTFDISVVCREPDGGWRVAASAGLDDAGGVDLDAAIVNRSLAALDPAYAQRLTEPSSTADYRARWTLWEDARAVKEQLSRTSAMTLPLPGGDGDIQVTREEFESLARPVLERTVTLTTATLFTSGVSADRLVGVFLVGGSSRVPAVGTLLHRALGVAPIVIEQPELVVALGSLVDLTAPAAAEPAAVADTAAVATAPEVVTAPEAVTEPAVVAEPAPKEEEPAAPAPRISRRRLLIGAAAGAAVLGGGAGWFLLRDDPRHVRTLTGHESIVGGLAFSRGDIELASAAWDKTVRIWSPSDGKQIRVLTGHTSSVYSVAYQPNHVQLASCGTDKTARLWDPTTGNLQHTLQRGPGDVDVVTYSADGSVLATVSDAVRIWNPSSGDLLRTITDFSGGLVSAAFAPTGTQLAVGNNDGVIFLFDASTGKLLDHLTGPTAIVEGLSYNANGDRLASAGVDKTVHIWNMQTRQQLRAITGYPEFFNAVAYAPSGNLLAAGGDDNKVWVWNPESGELLFKLSGHEDHIESIAFTSDSSMIATGSQDHTIRLWSTT